MVTEQTLIKFGFANDEDNSKLKEVFKNGIKLKEIYIHIYPENPLVNSSLSFMLLLRSVEKNATVAIYDCDDRFIIKKDTDYIMNVLFSEIKECYYKGNDYYSEFILNIQNIYYKITVLN